MKLYLLSALALLGATAAAAQDGGSGNWTGGYVFGMIGHETADGDNAHANNNSFGQAGGAYTHDGNGGIAGLGLGYNWTLGSGFVVGGEFAVRSGTKIDDGGEWAQYKNYTDSKLDSLATLKLRLGVDAGRWMPYVTAGVARGKLQSNQLIDSVPPQTFNGSRSATGSVIGLGADFKVTDRLFVGAEYNYTDLGSVEFSAPDMMATGGVARINGHYTSHDVVLRVGYRF